MSFWHQDLVPQRTSWMTYKTSLWAFMFSPVKWGLTWQPYTAVVKKKSNHETKMLGIYKTFNCCFSNIIYKYLTLWNIKETFWSHLVLTSWVRRMRSSIRSPSRRPCPPHRAACCGSDGQESAAPLWTCLPGTLSLTYHFKFVGKMQNLYDSLLKFSWWLCFYSLS